MGSEMCIRDRHSSLERDRSALSKELCKMRDEGLLTFEKNRFALNELPE